MHRTNRSKLALVLRPVLCATLVFATLSYVSVCHAREWTDASGKNTVEAEFVKLDGDTVHLRKADGEVVAIPLSKLSPPDIVFANSQAAGLAAGAGNSKLVTIDVDDANATGTIRSFGDIGWAIKSLAFSPNGGLLVAGKMDRAMMLFDVNAGTQLDLQKNLEHLGQITAVTFTPDGKEVIAASYQGVIEIFRVGNDRKLTAVRRFVGHTTEVKCMCISRDGQYVLSGDRDKTVRYWNVASCEQEFAVAGFRRAVQGVFISEKRGQGLAYDSEKLVLLNLKDGSVMQTMALPYSTNGAFFSSNGEHVAVCDSYNLRVFEIRTGKEIAVMNAGQIAWSMAFTNNGRYLLSGERGQVSVWDIAQQTRIATYNTKGSGYIQVLATSPDSRHFACIPSSAGQTLEILRLPAKLAAD